MLISFIRPVWFFILIVPLIISCRKEKSDAPEIVIYQPFSGRSYQIYDTIHVMAKVYDDNNINKLTGSLVNFSKTPVLPIQSLPVNQSDYTISFNLVLGNTEIPSGNYHVMIFASDGETETRVYVPVYINELPRELTRVYIAATDNDNSIKVFKRDSSEQPDLVITVPGDFIGSSISTRHHLFGLAGRSTGHFTAIHTESHAVQWTIPNFAIGGAPYFTGIGHDNVMSYISRYDGTIRGYNHTGNQQFFTLTDLNTYPGDALPVEDRLLVIETNIISGAQNVVIFNNPGGQTLLKIPINYHIESMIAKNNNEVYLTTNKNGTGQVLILDLTSGLTDTRLTLSTMHIMEAVKINEEMLIISTPDGLYEFSNSSNNLTPLVNNGNSQIMNYEETKNELYVAKGKSVVIYGYTLHNLMPLDTLLLSDSVRTIDFLYNREKFDQE